MIRQSLYIVIPAFNEAKVIENVLDSLPPRIKIGRKTLEITIVVVNDNSTDSTAQVVSRRRDVILINHLINMGAGAATRTGMRYARENSCDFLITMDADGQHHVEDALSAASEIVKNDQVDLVIGSRLINTDGMPFHRIVGNKGLSFVTYLLFGVFVTDSQSGLKAFNRKALDAINYTSNSYAFCSELLWRASKAKLRIKEIPIKAIYTDYSIGKGQSNWNALQIIRQLLKHRVQSILNG